MDFRTGLSKIRAADIGMLTVMAMTSLNVVMSFIIVADTIGLVDGLRCYKCDSTSNRDVCGADFKLTSSNTSFIIDNCDYCVKYRFADDSIYFRTCSERSGYTFKVGCDTCHASGTRVRSCYCNEDLCNGAISGMTVVPVLILVCLSIYYSHAAFVLKLM